MAFGLRALTVMLNVIVCLAARFNCGCGRLDYKSEYFVGENITLTCSVTDPRYLGGITVAQLYFMLADSVVESKVINHTAIMYHKQATILDSGNHICKIRTNKTNDPMLKTVDSASINILSFWNVTDVVCQLHNWEKLKCSFKKSGSGNEDIKFLVYLNSPQNREGVCQNKDFCTWDVRNSLTADDTKPWVLTIQQLFASQATSRRVNKSSRFEIYPLKNVIPDPVEKLKINLINNNATCLYLTWFYDPDNHFRKLFNITYKCCTTKFGSVVVENPNVTVCGLSTGSHYSFSVSVTADGRYFSREVSDEVTTMKYSIEKIIDLQAKKLNNGEIGGIAVGAVFALALIGCGLFFIVKHFKVKINECCQPFAFEDPSIIKEKADAERKLGSVDSDRSAPGSLESSTESETAPFIKKPLVATLSPIDNCTLAVVDDDNSEPSNYYSSMHSEDNCTVSTECEQTHNNNIINRNPTKPLSENVHINSVSTANTASNDTVQINDRFSDDYSKFAKTDDLDLTIAQIGCVTICAQSCNETNSQCQNLTNVQSDMSSESSRFDSSVESSGFRGAYSQPPKKYCETSSDNSGDYSSW